MRDEVHGRAHIGLYECMLIPFVSGSSLLLFCVMVYLSVCFLGIGRSGIDPSCRLAQTLGRLGFAVGTVELSL